jgi:hypothetical protein
LNYYEIDSDDVQDAIEWNEILLLRKIRRGILDGTVENIEITGGTFNFFVSTIIDTIFGSTEYSNHIYVHANSRLSSILESFKLLSMFKDRTFRNRIWISDQGNFDLFRQIHLTRDLLSHGVEFLEISVRELDIDRNLESEKEKYIIIYDHFNKTHDKSLGNIETFLQSKLSKESIGVFLIRCTRQIGVKVHSVFDGDTKLPSLAEISVLANDSESFVYYLWLDRFDREVFLPFEGEYGVSIVLAAPAEIPQAEELGFEMFRPGQPATGTSVATLEAFSRPTNYFSQFVGGLPILDDYVEPDWRAWAREFDWDPSTLDWSEGEFSDEFRFMIILNGPDKYDFSNIWKILFADGSGPHCSAQILVTMALVFNPTRPKEMYFLYFLALCQSGFEEPKLEDLAATVMANIFRQPAELNPEGLSWAKTMSQKVDWFMSFLDACGVCRLVEDEEADIKAVGLLVEFGIDEDVTQSFHSGLFAFRNGSSFDAQKVLK